MPTALIETLRDLWGEYGNTFRWHTQAGRWPGLVFTFSHACGDGCCSWSETYFLDDGHAILVEYADFFSRNASGEEWVYEESASDDE
jgi:hypothetical protein